MEIDQNIEYTSASKWQRVEKVIIPLLMKMKEDDYIEDILKCFDRYKGVFSIQINWIYDQKIKWKGVNYDSMHAI